MSSAWGNVFATGPNRNVYAVDLLSNLRALTPPIGSASIEVDGGTVVGDGLGGIFFFSAGSALADDGVNVIAPNSGTGRWIRSTQVGYNVFRKNAIINGGMEIAQRGTNFIAATDSSFTLDRWKHHRVGTMQHTISQDADVPTVLQAGQLFINSLRLNLTTPQAVIGVNDLCFPGQIIEGYNWRALAQRPCTLSFWVKATLPGVYSVALRNADSGRSFVSPFTINIANTWEKKIITTDSSPASGVWNYTNGIGVEIFIVLAAGSNFFTNAANVWTLDSNKFASANQINGVQAGATDFRITGVQLEAGSLNSEFERRTIQEELILCQRYFEKSFNAAIAPAQNVGANTGEYYFTANGVGAVGDSSSSVPFLVPKRIAPTMVSFNWGANNAQVRDRSLGADCAGTGISEIMERAFRVQCQGNAGTAVNNALGVHWTANAEL